ncbi:MAG: ECF transporter S component [Clostridiales bacterium]|jgi:uncharacterized membrane protein|nr:ECF transporter S component [Clostridiales bacterium]
MERKKFSVKTVALTGVMAALVFVSLNVSFPIPLVPGTAPTRIHIGNAVILLAGFLLGGKKGGLAAGIGAFFFDAVNPAYVQDALHTFAARFLMAFICGVITHAKYKGESRNADNLGLNIIGAVTASAFYVAQYLISKFLQVLTAQQGFWQSASYVLSGRLANTLGMSTALAATGTAAIASSINAVFGVAASVALCAAIKKAMVKANVTL